MRNQQSGFTLIELIVVIVILGILAATAVPKFIDLTSDADRAVADGVLGAANSACAMAFAQNRAKSQAATLTTAALVQAQITPMPAGWTALAKTANGKTYTISITAETTTAPCVATLAVT